MSPKEKLLNIVNSARGDDLERCQNAFRNLSPDQMKEQHGLSGLTRQELLESYQKEREEWQAAYDLLCAALSS